jgi:cobyrinic acid a,c-diamide synthase
MRAFVIGGTHSGCGKTTVTLGLLAALAERGLQVQSFKAGPDFIDSGLHGLATGRPSRNLDLWMCGEEYVRDSFLRHGSRADVSVVEGVMGLYDGALSTAHLARALRIPVVLVVDAYGLAESAGPIVKCFKEWSPSGASSMVELAGVIFNRVASESHFARVARSVKDVPVLGYLPRDVSFEIPHRHLGLVVAEENPVSTENLRRLSKSILEHVDVEGLLTASASPDVPSERAGGLAHPSRDLASSVRIAVAMDKAFCFYYQDNLDLLRAAGGEVISFSPLADAHLPEGIDGIYIGGGYPELHAAELSTNDTMRRSLKEWAESGRPLYAECGGLMYLCRSLSDLHGRVFDMTGIFPFRTVMTEGRAFLGYRRVSFSEDCMLGPKGQQVRGHEFHYSKIADQGVGREHGIYRVLDGYGNDLGTEGYRYRGVLGSYIHVHFGSNTRIAERFVESALSARAAFGASAISRRV